MQQSVREWELRKAVHYSPEVTSWSLQGDHDGGIPTNMKTGSVSPSQHQETRLRRDDYFCWEVSTSTLHSPLPADLQPSALNHRILSGGIPRGKMSSDAGVWSTAFIICGSLWWQKKKKEEKKFREPLILLQGFTAASREAWKMC